MADEKNEKAKPFELKAEETREATLLETFSPDRFEKFIMGEVTLGQLYGITIEEAYSIAEIGYTMLEQGRLKDAQIIYQGLVLSNPYDAYFHAVLGAIYQKLAMIDGAIEEYTISLALDASNVEAWVNRGELMIQKGNFIQAAEDFKIAIGMDPDAENPSANRARALAAIVAAALQQAIEKK